MKTALEIIDETAAFYKNENRSVVGVTCVYVGPGERRCAFSRCCSEEGIKKLAQIDTGPVSMQSAKTFEDVDKFLKPEYHGFSNEFWGDIQNLHDIERNWNDQGLSKEGVSSVSLLKLKWGERPQLA